MRLTEFLIENEFDDMVKRVGERAKQGPLVTVWDPVRKVYKNVPAPSLKPPAKKAEENEEYGNKYAEYVLQNYYVYGGNDEDNITIEEAKQKYFIRINGNIIQVLPEDPVNRRRAREIQREITTLQPRDDGGFLEGVVNELAELSQEDQKKRLIKAAKNSLPGRIKKWQDTTAAQDTAKTPEEFKKAEDKRIAAKVKVRKAAVASAGGESKQRAELEHRDNMSKYPDMARRIQSEATTLTFTNFLVENNEYAKLEKHKAPLTDDERSAVMKSKAVWHHGPNGEETPAVWKSVCPKTGKCTYITNTHRAYNTAPTVKGAISRYHKFIKGTA